MAETKQSPLPATDSLSLSSLSSLSLSLSLSLFVSNIFIALHDYKCK